MNIKQKISLLLVAVLVLAIPSSITSAYNTSSAKDYLLNHTDNPWSTMGLSLLNTSSIPNSYLKNVTGSSAIAYTAPILAITALNKNPRTFGSTNLVKKLKSFHKNNQIGSTSTLNDDIFGILALVASGEKESDMVEDARGYLLSHQNNDGGWGFTTAAASDTNTTAAAITALKAAGVSSNHNKIKKALNYLKTAQNNDGGFPYDPNSSLNTNSDSSSTAWVIWTLNAVRINPSSWSKPNGNPVSFLESTQTPAGYFAHQPGSGENSFSATNTSYSVIALSGKTLPLNIVDESDSNDDDDEETGGEFSFRIEGPDSTICQGQTEGLTALDIVKNSSSICGFTYDIKDTSFGPYLFKINDHQAKDTTGWLYLVNHISPSEGAADYKLEQGDEVIWYYGDFDWKPAKISASTTKLTTTENVTFTVEYFNGSRWHPLPEAEVFYGNKSGETNQNGTTVEELSPGYHQVYAEKEGFIRTNTLEFTSENTISHSANLSVVVEKNTETKEIENEETISFTIDPTDFSFGTVEPGTSTSEKITVHNTGDVRIKVKTLVEGDNFFTTYLRINGRKWSDFNAQLADGVSQKYLLMLRIPDDYNGTAGRKEGRIIFWATAK